MSADFHLRMKALKGEFPTATPEDLQRIVNDRQFERDLREQHGRKLGVGGPSPITDGVWRGRHNRLMWFDEPFNGLWDPGALQAAARMERGPLADGGIIFDIETRSPDEESLKLLATKTAFFEEVEVGCWPPPMSGTIVAVDTDKEEDDNA